MPIIVEKLAGYRRITLNRPERLNALTVEMAAALAAALDDAVADKTCRAILLTAQGAASAPGRTSPRSSARPRPTSTGCWRITTR